MKRKVVKLALSSLLLVGTLTEFAPKAAEASYFCPPMCCYYYRHGECSCSIQGYPVGNGYCYYEPCSVDSCGGTAS